MKNVDILIRAAHIVMYLSDEYLKTSIGVDGLEYFTVY